MRVQQFIKTLNNTEIGKGGTHEFYVLVSKKVKEIENIFDSLNHYPIFHNLKNGGVIENIHITAGREFRINGLGDFYRLNNVNAGDEIIFERRDEGERTEFFLNLKTKHNSIIFQKNSAGFEVLNSDRLNVLLTNQQYVTEVFYNEILGNLLVEFKESSKKRSDSPIETDFFTIKFNDNDFFENIKSNEFLELSITPNKTQLRKVIIWQTLSFNI